MPISSDSLRVGEGLLFPGQPLLPRASFLLIELCHTQISILSHAPWPCSSARRWVWLLLEEASPKEVKVNVANARGRGS